MNLFKNIRQLKLKNFKSRKALAVFIGLILFFLFSLTILKNQERQKTLKLSPTFPASDYLYQSKSKGFEVYLGNRQEKNLPQVKFASLGSSIDFKPLNSGKANLSKVENENSIVYQEILPGIDISYSLTPKGVKEEIIIKTQSAREKIIQDNSLLFEATVDKAVLNENQPSEKGVSFTDLGGKNPLFYIPQPFMIDFQGEKSEKIKIEFIPQSNGNQNQQNKFTVKMTPDSEWLKKAILPIIIDPTVEISIINIQSYPRTGDNWEVSFNTQGSSHLTITPDSQDSIRDLDFISLSCGSQIFNPQILENDVIFYPDWECGQEGKIIHKVNRARNHILKFQFGEQTAFAYNAGPPLAPTSLQTEGQTNPINVGEGTPEFSAVYNDPDESDIANKYWIQVDDNSNFSSPVWDSGSSGTAMADCNEGERCQEISYAGSSLDKTITYYWQIKFWDDEGGEGEWSNTASLNTSLDFQPADESGFLQEDLAYNTSMIPSGTAGIITLTLGSGNWNDNSKIKSGAKVTGNGGVATITEVPGEQDTIQAKVDTSFNDDNEISAGDWHLYATKFSDLEELVLNDFSGRKNFSTSSTPGPVNTSDIAVTLIDTDKLLIIFRDTDNGSMWTGVVASISGTTITYGDETLVDALPYDYGTDENSVLDAGIVKIDTNKALVVFSMWLGYGDSYDAAFVATVSGTTVTFGQKYRYRNGGAASDPEVALLGTNKVLIAFSDSAHSYHGTAIVASISGTTISFGSEAIYESTGSAQYNSVAQLDADKAIITYRNSSNAAIAIVASVSGTTITYGDKATVVNSIYYNPATVIQLTTDKALVAYGDYGDSNHGKAKVATVSGTTISWGDEAEFLGSQTYYDTSLALIGTDKVIISYSGHYAKVASISGTTITYGSAATIGPSAYNLSMATIGTDKALASFSDQYNNYYGYSEVLTVSGTTITANDEYIFNNSGYRVDEAVTTQIDTDKILISYTINGDRDGKAVVASVSGTTVTYGEEVTFNSGHTQSVSSLKLDTNKVLIVYGSYIPYATYGYAVVASVSGTTISLGEASQWQIEGCDSIAVARLNTDKALIVYNDYDDYYSKAIVASVSGTTISYGDESASFSGETWNIRTTTLATDKAFVVYVDADDNYSNKGIVASVSGTTISWGSPVATGGTWDEIYLDQLDTDKAILVYNDNAVVASVSGTTITYGSEVSFSYDASGINVASIDTNKAIVTYSRYNESFQGMAAIITVSGTTITVGEEYRFNEAFTDFCQPAKIDTDKALFVYNRFATNQNKATEGYGTAVAADISGTTITSFYGQLHYSPGDYFTTTTSDINQINVADWLDINSGTISETLNSQTINYGVSFDGRTTWKIYDATEGDAGWRPIARNNSGTWEYNSNVTAGATDITWTSATTNTQFGALDQAFQIAANQLTGTEFNSITDAQWEETGGFDPNSTTILDFAFGLKTTSETVTPQLSGITIDYDNNPDYFAIADQIQLKGLNLSGITIE